MKTHFPARARDPLLFFVHFRRHPPAEYIESGYARATRSARRSFFLLCLYRVGYIRTPAAREWLMKARADAGEKAQIKQQKDVFVCCSSYCRRPVQQEMEHARESAGGGGGGYLAYRNSSFCLFFEVLFPCIGSIVQYSFDSGVARIYWVRSENRWDS